MRKIVLIGIMLVLTAQAQQIPVEVQKIMDDYKKNPAIGLGFNMARADYINDTTIHFSDIEIGIPYEEYYFVKDSLNKLPDTVPVASVIAHKGKRLFQAMSRRTVSATAMYRPTGHCLKSIRV
jgi:hypothetical protein